VDSFQIELYGLSLINDKSQSRAHATSTASTAMMPIKALDVNSTVVIANSLLPLVGLFAKAFIRLPFIISPMISGFVLIIRVVNSASFT